MGFQAGQTFLFPLAENQTAHLWVIATEPNADGFFATVSFTSLRGAKDQTVTLLAAEHPFVKWDTCVLYASAEIMNVKKLQGNIDCGVAKMHWDVSPRILALIVDGFAASDHTKNRVREFVRLAKKAGAPIKPQPPAGRPCR